MSFWTIEVCLDPSSMFGPPQQLFRLPTFFWAPHISFWTTEVNFRPTNMSSWPFSIFLDHQNMLWTISRSALALLWTMQMYVCTPQMYFYCASNVFLGHLNALLKRQNVFGPLESLFESIECLLEPPKYPFKWTLQIFWNFWITEMCMEPLQIGLDHSNAFLDH